jgi:predicted signal transduction protein with EAL and GGDEF domain
VLLCWLAERLADGVPQGARIARVGGDEFAVLLPGVTLQQPAVAAGRVLRELLSAPVLVNDVDVRVAVSIGVALAPRHANDVTSLLRAAGSALEDARSAPGRIRAYDRSAVAPSGQTQLAVLADLRRALERDELTVYVQPQAHAGTGEVLGVEALVRWVHPVHGLLAPDRFLPLAQRHDLMTQLTQTVLARTVLAWTASAAAQWREQGLDLNVAVNLDPSTLADDDLPQRLAATLEAARLPADRLTLEITEDSMINDPDAVLTMLRRLRLLGAGLSVDDYGTGYASL